MNPYKNLLAKIKALLKEDDQLTKGQCEQFQWQLLVKIPGDYTFTVGKGGVNTIFYTASNTNREVCYPEDIIIILERLARNEVFTYAAFDRYKERIGYSIDIDTAKEMPLAMYIAAINFNGKRKIVERKMKNLVGKRVWQKLNN